MHYNDNPNIFPPDLYFLMPCSDLLLNIFNIFGLKLGEKIGPKNAILLSVSLELISLAILLFIPKYIMSLISMGIFGIGISMNSLIITKNGWKYFPNKKGLVNGINMSASGLSSSFLIPIADYILINPKKLNTTKDGIYPIEISDNLPRYLYFLISIFVIIGSISYFTTFNFKDNKTITGNEVNEEKILDYTIEENQDEEEKGQEEQIVNKEKEKEEQNVRDNNEEEKYSNNQTIITTKKLLSLFFSKKNAQILSISIGGPCKIIIL